MHRRTLLRTGVIATLPLVGCVGDRPRDQSGTRDVEYPDKWRHVSPHDADIVTFDKGRFQVTATDVQDELEWFNGPPDEGTSLNRLEVEKLLRDTEIILHHFEESFRLALEIYFDTGDDEDIFRWTLWWNMGEQIVYQERSDLSNAYEILSYNDGTRYVAKTEDDETVRLIADVRLSVRPIFGECTA